MRVKRANIRVKKRLAHYYKLLQFVRQFSLLILVSTMIIGGARWLTLPSDLGALEFTPRKIYQGTGEPNYKDLVTSDLDQDGDNDIIATGVGGVFVFENQGDFVFQRHRIDDKNAERVQILDLDKDDRLDILVSYKGSSPAVRWFEKKDAGQFDYTTREIATAGSDAVVYAGDIDDDDDPDIITASKVGELVELERWINDGTGTFVATTILADSGVSAISIFNLDDDIYRDIITTGTQGLVRWDYDGVSAWERIDLDDSHTNRTHLVAGLSGTGSIFIGTVDHVTNIVALYKKGPGASDFTYGRQEIATSVDGKTIRHLDLDEDGDLDYLVAAQDDNEVLWFSKEDAVFTKKTIATGLKSVYSVAASDIDNDNDLDVVTSDHKDGDIFVYERLIKKPVVTAPDSISQSADATGLITFKTKVSDKDSDETSLRLQYSLDGEHWYKPWLTKVEVDDGSVDLKNSNGYQIGTSNPIDTDTNDEVELTITWDTKTAKNTGPAVVGDLGSVQLRAFPLDNREKGEVVFSSKFRVDNGAPTDVGGVVVSSIDEDSATLTWNKPSDSSAFIYQVYYGTDHAKVLEKDSAIWDSDDDDELSDVDTATTTITGLDADKKYTFKLYVTDVFGNEQAAASVQGTTTTTIDGSPAPTTSPITDPTGEPTATPISSPIVSTSPTATPSPTPTSTPTPTPTPSPSVLKENRAPIADAGQDQVVNANALVVLNGAGSIDADPGETSQLNYSWRQLDGPQVNLLSERTPSPSFSAGSTGDSYVFALTVRDPSGASAIDTVTIATHSVVVQDPEPIIPIDEPKITIDDPDPEPRTAGIVSILKPIDYALFVLALLSSLMLIAERVLRSFSKVKKKSTVAIPEGQPHGTVVHHQTGKPIADAQVQVFGSDGKLRQRERTNDRGVFPTFFPKGQYRLGVTLPGFVIASAASKTVAPPGSILYSGGNLVVKQANQPLSIVIPVKPTSEEVSTANVKLSHAWQWVQRWLHWLSWIIFVTGALLNTVLVFLDPGLLLLILEASYIILVVIKIAMEIKVSPAYGLVRDAITHVPLDLAVVRLFDAGSHKLIMTRVTNGQGKFFALPPAGNYTITVSKPGFATFSKDNIKIASSRDTTLQLTADLMPVRPVGSKTGLSAAKAATI